MDQVTHKWEPSKRLQLLMARHTKQETHKKRAVPSPTQPDMRHAPIVYASQGLFEVLDQRERRFPSMSAYTRIYNALQRATQDETLSSGVTAIQFFVMLQNTKVEGKSIRWGRNYPGALPIVDGIGVQSLAILRTVLYD